MAALVASVSGKPKSSNAQSDRGRGRGERGRGRGRGGRGRGRGERGRGRGGRGRGRGIVKSESPEPTGDENHQKKGNQKLTPARRKELVLKAKIQIEYYFSDANYPKDKFLLEQAAKNDGCMETFFD